MKKWFKYTFVCNGECNALIEYTFQIGYTINDVTKITCLCGSPTTYVSVEDATILPNNQQKEENMEDTVTKDAVIAMWRQELELTYGNKITELQNQLSAATQRIEQLQNIAGSANSQLGKIIDNLTEDNWYHDGEGKEEILEQLCVILDHNPVKEVSFEATVRVSGRMNVPLGEDYDLEDILSDISVDIYNGDVVFDDISVDMVDEL